MQLGGYKGEIELGDTVAIQYRHKQVQFRVTWIITRKGSLEKQIGAECLEPEKQLWGTAFPEQPDEYEEKTRSSFLGILVAIVGVKGSSYSQEHVIGSFIGLWLSQKHPLANTASGEYGFPLLDILKLQISVMFLHADSFPKVGIRRYPADFTSPLPRASAVVGSVGSSFVLGEGLHPGYKRRAEAS